MFPALRFIHAAVLAALIHIVFLSAPPSALADTIVKLGAITQITGPQDLDLDGEMAYAINFSTDDPIRTLAGVRFLPDNQTIPGATLIGPQQVTPWQAKPEFGNSADANALELILHDIRWANSGAGERLRATLNITNGFEYKLQILISGNGPENRRWDIRVAGREAVDEITSLGAAPSASYSVNRSTLYTYQFVANTNRLVIEMGDLFGRNDGGDRNPIWQALTLERVFIPPTPENIILTANRFFPVQTASISDIQVVDRKSGATHTLSLVPGAGDLDNSKFMLEGNALKPGAFNFSSLPVGTAFSIRLRATDASDSARFLEKAFVLTLAAPNPPSGIALDVSSIPAPPQPGQLLALISVLDPDSFDRHQLSLDPGVGSDDNGLVRIEASQLRLTSPIPAGKSSIKVRIGASDLAGLSVSSLFELPLVASQIRINEVVAGEAGGIPDEGGNPVEWIELHNPLAQWAQLDGYYLTDQPSDLRRWQFPPVVIPPMGYLLVLADGLGASPAGSSLLHANFSISAGGSRIMLAAPDGRRVLSELRAPEFFPGVAYGVGADDQPGYLPKPTPGAVNGPVAPHGENRVSFSHPRGFYARNFPLTLTADLPGSIIRYTLDGSLPSPTRGSNYLGPITVRPSSSGSTRGVRIVRAIAVHTNAAFAPAATATYLFVQGDVAPATDGVVSQSQLNTSITRNTNYASFIDDALLALPTLSLILGETLSTSEQAASVEFFDPENREAGFQINCGVHATGTTSLGSPKLSMAAKFKHQYGKSKLRYPVYARGSLAPPGGATEFDELRLRSHSHDTFYWLGTSENPPVPYGSPPVQRSGDAQLGRNLWIEEMQLLMGQPGKRGRQTHLYLNGAYHGIYHIQEHADEDFMASYYPGSSTDFHFSASAIGGSEHANGDSWRTTWGQLKASLGNYSQAIRWIDVTNLCDYMTLSFYAGNDWDWSTQHNWSAAGPKAIDKGGWKFFQQDSDISLQDVNADCTDQDVPDGIFTALMNHSDFRSLFRDRVYLHCFNNGVLTPVRAGDLYNARMNEISTAIVAETARWQPGSSVASLPWDRNQEWTNEWNYLRTTFFPNRVNQLIPQLRAHANWWPTDPPVLSELRGEVSLGHKLRITTLTSLVYYTTDGSDPRLPGGRINPAAKRLAAALRQTSLIATGTVWRFLDTGQEPGSNWIHSAFDDSAWRAGRTEIGYGDGGETTVANFVDTDPVRTGVQRNITTYFRKAFDATNAPSFDSLRLRLVRDDGAVVYLNGLEIWRTNMPSGPITSTNRATRDVSGAEESAFHETVLPALPGLLQLSNNILAVEIHQRLPESPDMSFNLELVGTSPDPASFVTIDRPLLVRARAHTGTDWSALAESFLVPNSQPRASSDNLLLTQIHFRPWDQTANEFLVFQNTSSQTIDLSDVRISEAIDFTFAPLTSLAPAESICVIRDAVLFRARYATNTSPYRQNRLKIAGVYEGSLANDGELIRVTDANGQLILQCRYEVNGLWPHLAEGRGAAMVLRDREQAPSTSDSLSAWLSNPLQWRATQEFHGAPGGVTTTQFGPIVINRVLPAPFPPGEDAIELFNIGSQEADISGWFLSDGSGNFKKYQFPEGTRILPQGRKVLLEHEFNTAGALGVLAPFALDDQGEQLFLMQASPQGDLLRFGDWMEFGPLPRGMAIGRWPDGTGPFRWLSSVNVGTSDARLALGYDAWAATRFPPGTTNSLTSPNGDPDADGILNKAERAFGLDPLSPETSPLQIHRTQQGGLEIRYTIASGSDEWDYRLNVSQDLTQWRDAGNEIASTRQEPRLDGATTVIVMLNQGIPPLFCRLIATQKP